MLTFRNRLTAGDKVKLRNLVTSAGVFHDYETDMAVELAECNIEMGEKQSGYYFIIAEDEGKLAGYVCFGPIPCTRGSYDLYWIVVDKGRQGSGLAKRLMEAAEAGISEMGGWKVYVETSSTNAYIAARRFYEKCGYSREALFEDYYKDGDDKVVFVRHI